jgi:FxsC-like protein
MAYQFFFSYARDSTDNYLPRFFKDLCGEVRRRKNPPPPEDEIGFRDTSGIKAGAEWTAELKEALRTSLSLVYILSPDFIYREFCGKEFEIFRRRLALDPKPNAEERGKNPVVLPVVWVPIKGWMPEPLRARQWHDDSLLSEYKTYGLRQLMNLSRFRDKYREFVTLFADKIIAATEGPALPRLRAMPAFKNVPDAFRRTTPTAGPGAAKAAAQESPGGPTEAIFVFVAAPWPEIQTVRSDPARCHEGGGWGWRPYRPADEDTIGKVAQRVSADEKIRYNELRLSKGIIRGLKNALKRREIVVILVDAWTLRLPVYRDQVKLFDAISLPNFAVLIPWNESDAETLTAKPLLETALRVALPSRSVSAAPPYFRAPIRSAGDLLDELRTTLAEVQMNLIMLGDAEKAIAGPHIPAPMLALPGGEGS